MSERRSIIPDMPIFGSDGALVGTVDRVSPTRILVNHVGASEADEFAIPLARVADVSDRVTLDRPAAEARAVDSSAGEARRSRVPLLWLAVALVAVGLIYGTTTMILRGGAAPRPGASESAKPPSASMVPAAAAAPGALGAPPRPAAPNALTPASVGRYLASDSPAGQAFAFDKGFSPGGALLDADGKAMIAGLAAVMASHRNTQIKLAASGTLGLRRAAAIKAALLGSGVAEYRIATGSARDGRRGTPGVALIVLAK
ncbi:DUF2171 domain-containing protein [Sphingomonas sp.]|jgi:outer membrane protein OmpA-like peptidoglycan-associated protein|uniref:DUF2171 domain-containing protein n=1 Tax=Sphingomonas sp. TaxID=28214 RepID=UPI002E34BF33|nr:DUF2171 domain-containing protein [Sphingomonas sp.]HEX4694314.1 DUF2171 domain-containing protein [Sphingomonas sp.]